MSLELGKIFLPLYIDYKEETGNITFRVPDYGTEGYFDNSECYLEITINCDHATIDYYCEDGNYLSDIFKDFSYEEDGLAGGDLKNETFGSIQDRVLKVLIEHLDESQSREEIMEFFN